MFRKRSSKKAGVKLLATLLCVLLFLLLFAQSVSAAPLGPGDVNSDGKINVRDVVLVQRHILGLSLLTAEQKALAIVKGFGAEPDVRDVVLIMQYAIGKISTFPTQTGVISPAFSTVTATTTVTITLTGGTFKAAPITAADFTFAGDNAARLAAGTFTRTSDTVVTITGLTTMVAAANNTVTVKDATMAVKASSVAAASVIAPITSASFPTSAGTNRVTITLTGGTFKAVPIDADDFIFTGDNAALLAAGSFTRTSDTVVTITGLAGIVADTNNRVTVKAATMATQATSVTGAATTILARTSPEFLDVLGDNTVRVTLNGGAFKDAPIVAGADITFGGDNAAVLLNGNITRINNTTVVITLKATSPAFGVYSNNTVTVLPSAMAAQATSVTGVASKIEPVQTLVAFSSSAGNNTVTITLTAPGIFRSGTITNADFAFQGDNHAKFAGKTFTRASDRVVIVTGLNLVAAGNNQITVNPSAMAVRAPSVIGSASTRDAVTSPAYETKATNKKVTITLTGGTFKAGPISAGDFDFVGTNASYLSALPASHFTRTSDTVVTISGLTLEAATNNTVTVKVTTFATQTASPSVAVVASD